MISTYLLSRRITSHSVESFVEGPSVQLGNGTHSMVKGVQGVRVLSNDFWKQTSGSVVAHIGGKHIKFSGKR